MIVKLKISSFTLLFLLVFFSSMNTWADINDGLIAHFTFDQTLQSEINSYEINVVDSDNISYTTGVSNQSLIFDSKQNFVQATASEERYYTEFTLSFWAKNGNKQGMLIGITDSSKTDKGYIYFYNNHFYVNFDNDSHYYTDNNEVWSKGWAFYAVVYDGNKVFLYVNGKKTKWSALRKYKLYNSFLFGNGKGYIYNYEGLLDDVRVYDRVLSDSENLELFLNFNYDFQEGYLAGKKSCIDNPASCGITNEGLYTEDDMLNMVNKLLEWDKNKDNKIGLVEVIQALRDLTGRQQN